MLKAVLDTLEGVPEALHEHYAKDEKDGKFYLNADGVDDLPTVRGLKTTLSKFKEVAPDASSLKKKLERLEALKDVDLEEYDQLKTAERTKAEKDAEEKGDFNTLKSQLEDQHAKEMDKKDEAIFERDSFIHTLLIDNKLNEGIDKIEVLPEYKAAVRALLMVRKPKVVRDEDGAYRAIFKTDMGEAEIGEFVEAWGKSDEAAPFQKPTGRTGSDARGSHGRGAAEVNPFARETFNLSKQGELLKTNPAKARQLADAAGVALQE
ncbi:MAG: hypothetical protein M3418_10605 [Gemmatimonadota bacterium]|nr:hypothetical protein [Gemmatimonadota bacterium]